MNLTVATTHPAKGIIVVERDHKKYAYRINVTQALSKMKDTIVLLFKRSNIIAIEPVWPGTKYPRKHSVQKRDFYTCYKRIRKVNDIELIVSSKRELSTKVSARIYRMTICSLLVTA